MIELLPHVKQTKTEKEREVDEWQVYQEGILGMEETRANLLRAAVDGDWLEIKTLLAKDVDRENFIFSEDCIDPRNDNTIFLALAYYEHDKLLSKVLSKYFINGATPLNCPNVALDYPLHLAVQQEHHQVVKVLLYQGEAWRELHKANKFGETAFHAASMQTNDHILMELIRCWKKVQRFDTKKSQLSDNEKSLRSEIRKSLAARTEVSKYTFFHYLVIRKCYDAAILVLDESGTKEKLLVGNIACHHTDANGDTALMLLLKNEASFFKSWTGRSKRLFKPMTPDEQNEQRLRRERGCVVFPTYGWTWGRTVSPAAKLLVKLLHVWSVWSNPRFSSKRQDKRRDKVLTHLANLGLGRAVEACISQRGMQLRVHQDGSQPTLLQIAARDRMEGFIEWLISPGNTDNDWKRVMLQTADGKERTALHYAAMTAAKEKGFPLARFATEIKADYKWFEKIKGLMPLDLVSRKAWPFKKTDHKAARQGETPEKETDTKIDHNAARPGETPENETAEEMFLHLHEEMARKNAESLRAIATTIMSLIAAVAFATSFTLPSGVSDKSSGQLKSKEEITLSVFAGAYVMGLSFAVTSIITSLYLYLAPFDVQSFLTTVPMRFYLCLANLCLCVLSLLVAFACNLRLSLDKYHINKLNCLYAFPAVGPLTIAAYFAFRPIRHIYRQAKSFFAGQFDKLICSWSGLGATDSHRQVKRIQVNAYSETGRQRASATLP